MYYYCFFARVLLRQVCFPPAERAKCMSWPTLIGDVLSRLQGYRESVGQSRGRRRVSSYQTGKLPLSRRERFALLGMYITYIKTCFISRSSEGVDLDLTSSYRSILVSNTLPVV